MSNYTDSVPESLAAAVTKTVAIATADYYFTTDPKKLDFTQLDSLWRRSWEPLGRFPNQLSLVRLIRHFTRGKLFLDINREFVLLANGQVYRGTVATHKVFDRIVEWLEAFLTQNQETERVLAVKFITQAMIEFTNHKQRETIKALLRSTLMSEAIDERGEVFKKSDLPCLVRSKDKKEVWLGKFSMLTGKIEKITTVGLFPVLSGLEFEDGYELKPRKTFAESGFRSYLTNLVGSDENRLAFMGRLMGILCEEGNDLQVWVWLQGPAGNGKTVFIDLVATILGQLATKGDNSAYDGSEKDQRFARAAMENRRLAYFSELSKWFRLHDGKLKGDTEGNLRIENKHKDSREITNTCKPIFISNHPVNISDDTEATRGRMILLDTTGVNWRKADNRINRYHEVLWQNERDTILQFLVDSYRVLKTTGLQVPECYRGDTEENRLKTIYLSDRHSEYLSERIVRQGGSELSAAEIENDYKYWLLCEGWGEVNRKDIDALHKAVTRVYGAAQKSNGKMKRKGLALAAVVKAEEEMGKVVDKINGGI